MGSFGWIEVVFWAAMAGGIVVRLIVVLRRRRTERGREALRSAFAPWWTRWRCNRRSMAGRPRHRWTCRPHTGLRRRARIPIGDRVTSPRTSVGPRSDGAGR